MMTKQFFTLCFLLMTFSAFAQQPLQLSEAIKEMKANNTQLKIQDNEIKLANSELNATQSGFLPKLSVSHTGLYPNDPLNAFGFKLQQNVVSQADFNLSLIHIEMCIRDRSKPNSKAKPRITFCTKPSMVLTEKRL